MIAIEKFWDSGIIMSTEENISKIDFLIREICFFFFI